MEELQELEELSILEAEGQAQAAAPSAAATDSVFNFPAVPAAAPMPAVPTGSLAYAAETEDERALRELQASMM